MEETPTAVRWKVTLTVTPTAQRSERQAYHQLPHTLSGDPISLIHSMFASTIPLFPKLSSLLLEIRDSTKDLGDKVITIKSARKALLTSCVKTGLSPYTQHSLRHYFASEAVQKGIDFKTISEWLGHKDGGMLVAKTYSHLRDNHSWEIAQIMI